MRVPNFIGSFFKGDMGMQSPPDVGSWGANADAETPMDITFAQQVVGDDNGAVALF